MSIANELHDIRIKYFSPKINIYGCMKINSQKDGRQKGHTKWSQTFTSPESVPRKLLNFSSMTKFQTDMFLFVRRHSLLLYRM